MVSNHRVVLLVIGCIAYGYHEHHKPKTAQELKTVRVAYLPITHALPVFATKELETADGPVHVELVKYGSWPELMDALNTGKVDAAAVLVELGVKAREQGIDVRAAALGHTEGNIIIVNKDINSVQDLKANPLLSLINNLLKKFSWIACLNKRVFLKKMYKS